MTTFEQTKSYVEWKDGGCIVATVKSVLSHMGNRIYELDFHEVIVNRKSAYIKLDLDGHMDERAYFYRVEPDGTVMVNIHECPDVRESQIGKANVYYVWQRRSLDRMTSTCPRCKYRLDAPRVRG